MKQPCRCVPRRRCALPGILVLLLATACAGSILSEEAREEFLARDQAFSLTVYPVHVVKGPTVEHDAELAGKLAELLSAEGLANPVLAERPVEVPVVWGRNEARMLRESAALFARRIRETGLETDYALLVEILTNDDETRVGGIHYYLVDGQGRVADGRLCNSHHDEFKAVEPRDRAGGYEVLARLLIHEWRG